MLSTTSWVQLLRIMEMPRVDNLRKCSTCNAVRERLMEMEIQAESVRDHIYRSKFLNVVQWDSSLAMQSEDMLTMLRSTYRSLLDSMVVVGKVATLNVSGCNYPPSLLPSLQDH